MQMTGTMAVSTYNLKCSRCKIKQRLSLKNFACARLLIFHWTGVNLFLNLFCPGLRDEALILEELKKTETFFPLDYLFSICMSGLFTLPSRYMSFLPFCACHGRRPVFHNRPSVYAVDIRLICLCQCYLYAYTCSIVVRLYAYNVIP